MSERFWARIRIGGPVPDSLLPELKTQLCQADLISSESVDLSDFSDGDGVLGFEDGAACWGYFEELEEWLENNEIEFDRKSDGCCDISPEKVSCRRATGKRSFILDHSGNVVIQADEVLALANGGNLQNLIGWLAKEAGVGIDPLQPFAAAPPAAMAMDELKRRNTDPSASACAQCGAVLADPIPGMHSMKHCPKCEP